MNEHRDKALQLLGLARKGHLLVAGRTAVMRNFHRGKLLILAQDLSRKTKDRWIREARIQGVDYMVRWKMDELGAAIGHKPVGIILILDRGMAEKLKSSL